MALGHSRGSETASLFPEGLVLGLTQLSHTQCVCPLPGTPTQAALGEVSLQGSGAHLLLPCPPPPRLLRVACDGPLLYGGFSVSGERACLCRAPQGAT